MNLVDIYFDISLVSNFFNFGVNLVKIYIVISLFEYFVNLVNRVDIGS